MAESIVPSCCYNIIIIAIFRNCNQVDDDIFNEITPNAQKLCTQAMSYLFEIYYNKNVDLKGAGCLFLYYSLYNESIKHGKKSSNIKQLHDKFIDIYNKIHYGNTIEKAYYKDINNDVVNNLSVIYKVFSCINNTEVSDISTDGKNFCDAVEIIKNEYNLIILEKGSETSKQQISEYCQSNIKIPIIITILVLLIPSFLLFILYKFTPYGSYILSAIKWKRKVYNNTDKEWNIMQSSENFNDLPRNMQYKMSYNSDKL
ncbi:variable surface protein [Plasmodium gonderi]|uniref:Variable surface protein n=1 Tax=Plasmodium gonderi TaxID=77519 RepID=A0A1Y1JT35_PLAGO|nr:variable surface protein [Plasmodium gonderi]GAW83942.1 variable surface protein [Plasmodium gonderi]